MLNGLISVLIKPVQKLESIQSAGCLMKLQYWAHPQEGCSPLEHLASCSSLQEQLQSGPNCDILVPLLGLMESPKLILTCDSSNKRSEDLSLDVFLAEWKRDRVSLLYQQLLHYKMPSFCTMKYMAFFEIPPNYFNFIYYTTYECENPRVLQLPLDAFLQQVTRANEGKKSNYNSINGCLLVNHPPLFTLLSCFSGCIRRYTRFAFLSVENKSITRQRGSNTLNAMLE